jgi:hypothetical protein
MVGKSVLTGFELVEFSTTQQILLSTGLGKHSDSSRGCQMESTHLHSILIAIVGQRSRPVSIWQYSITGMVSFPVVDQGNRKRKTTLLYLTGADQR